MSCPPSTMPGLLCACLLLSTNAAPYPTAGWKKAKPEALSMSSAGLAAATAWLDSLEHPDAFIVVRGGYIVAETYWGDTNKDTLHDLESGTKSIGAMALAHAMHHGHFSFETKISDYFPGMHGLEPNASSIPLKLKHLVSMSGGANVTYWQAGPQFGLTEAWTKGLRQGPPGEVQSCTQHGIRKRPSTDFRYSFANPAIASGLLAKTTGSSYAKYLDANLFPVLGINTSEWRWLGITRVTPSLTAARSTPQETMRSSLT